MLCKIIPWISRFNAENIYFIRLQIAFQASSAVFLPEPRALCVHFSTLMTGRFRNTQISLVMQVMKEITIFLSTEIEVLSEWPKRVTDQIPLFSVD